MFLKRYNEVLIAVVGTTLAIGVSVLAIRSFLVATRFAPPARVVINRSNNGKSLKQSIAMCSPILVSGSDYELLPIAAVRDDGSAGNVSISSASLSSSVGERLSRPRICDLPVGSSYAVFNVVVRNISTNFQTLLLDHPAQVDSVETPRSDCASEGSTHPCGHLFWWIRDDDTNGEQAPEVEESESLFISDLSARGLVRLSPKGVRTLNWVWDRRSSEILIQVQHRSPDGRFPKQGGEEVLSSRLPAPTEGVPLLQRDVSQQLQRSIH